MDSSTNTCRWADERALSHEATSCGDDDVISLCSWTTDQGDFSDLDTCTPSRKTTAESQVGTNSIDGNNYVNGSLPGSWSYCQEGGSDGVNNGANVYNGVNNGVNCYNGVSNGMPVAWPMYGSYVMCFVVPPAGSILSNDENLVPMEPPGTWSNSTMPVSATQGPHQNSNGTKTRYVGSSNCRGGKEGESERTTIILRNLPLECTRNELLRILDAEGFWGCYDFLHLPVDFQTKAGLGYALLNLVSPSAASRVKNHFTGFSSWPFRSENVCTVAWNTPQQGLAMHVDRYRNSPLMHASVPEVYRPVLFKNGVRKNFPAPSARIRAPRIRHSKPAMLDSMAEA